MKIAIIGGSGFLGQKLAGKLLDLETLFVHEKHSPISQIIIYDLHIPDDPIEDPSIHYQSGDITERSYLKSIVDERPDIIFHLAAIVSGQAEKNFELGMKVNLEANLCLLEMIRSSDHIPVFVFAGTCGVFGGDLDQKVTDRTAPVPQSSYGTQKAICDLLINDYSRRGWIDGRVLRLPTIAIRPGKPNAATSTFVSSIVREPLLGRRAECPVSPEVKVWILSPRCAIENFIHCTSLTAEKLGKNRIINLPGITVTIAEIVDALREVGGSHIIDLVEWKPDAFIQSIVLTWPPFFETSRALELGFIHDKSAREIIQAFIEDDLNRAFA